MQHGAEAQHDARALELLGVGVLRRVHIGDGIGQWAIVAQTACEHKRNSGLDAFVHHAAFQLAGFHGLGDAARVINRVDGAHVVAMAVLLLAAVALAHAERSAQQRGFNIVHAERVARDMVAAPTVTRVPRLDSWSPPVWMTTGPATTMIFCPASRAERIRPATWRTAAST